MEKERFKTVWISDVHIGSRMTQTALLLDFLYSIETENLFLVGDIIDVWSLTLRWHWEQRHTNLIRRFLSFARDGTKVVFIAGNHDDVFRDFVGFKFGEVEIRKDCVYETSAGKKLLVLHGDEFDLVTSKYKWLAVLGSYVYETLLYVNRFYNRLRRLLGLEYWSLAGYLKRRTKNVVRVISNFEFALANAAKLRGFAGVVAGHIHHPETRVLDGVTYYNCGDWVESCTALVEDLSGRIRIIEWTDAARAF